MTTIITRLYATPEKAAEVAAALHAGRFGKQLVSVITDDAAGGVRAAIGKVGVYAAAADIYAKHVAGGEALVVVQAPYGRAVQAVNLLDTFEAVPTAVRHTEAYVESKETPKTSLSSKNLPVLLNSDVLVMSDGMFPRAVFRKNAFFSSLFGLPLLSGSNGPMSSLIETNTTPFSSMFGLPTLTRSQEPKAGLVKGGTPLSSALGLPTLTKND
jgi:hypothetical protein